VRFALERLGRLKERPARAPPLDAVTSESDEFAQPPTESAVRTSKLLEASRGAKRNPKRMIFKPRDLRIRVGQPAAIKR
jgi:hypothetical protein